jgi:hypothetical protein
MIELMIVNNQHNKKEIFSELREQLYLKDVTNHINEVKISYLKNSNIINEIKTLQVIDLDNLESFLSYVNYDHFLMFKFEDDYYFCDTELTPSLGINSLLKILDFNQHLRKDKIKKLNTN